MNRTNFFLKDDDCDPGYRNVRGRRQLRPVKEYVEKLWEEYVDLADKHFLQEAKHNFLQRFWEMYLAVALRRNGLTPVKVGGEGPEFYFIFEDRKVWVEAIAPLAGVGPDRVPRYRRDQFFRVPEEKVVLRFTIALAEKRNKYVEAVRKGIITPEDAFIVAINSRAIPHARYGSTLPFAIKAFLPFGRAAIGFNITTGKKVNSYHEYRDRVRKRSGTTIPTTAFFDPEYACISAVIHSAVDAVNSTVDIGSDFFVLHNPSAKVEIGLQVFPFCLQYTFDKNRLAKHEPRRDARRHAKGPASYP